MEETTKQDGRNHEAVGFLTGDELFTYNGKRMVFDVKLFWRFQFSNLWDMQGEVGEFVVSMALGNIVPDNKNGWTQYDIDYREKRIEVKTTAYYQPWKPEGVEVSMQRTWSIRKAHEKEGDPTSPLVRNNDVYVFVLIEGKNAVDANPMKLEHFKFWVIPTKLINDECGNNKSISLGKVKRLAKMRHFPEGGIGFADLRRAVDEVIDSL